MAGWIKVYRDLSKHWLSQDMEKLGMWVDLLFLASYEDNKVLVGNRLVEVKRGQLIGSISFFKERWNVNKDKVISFFRLLQADKMIDKVTDKNVTLITICNYESYQEVSSSTSDNLPDNLSDRKSDNLPDNLPDTTKEIKEIKNIYNTTTAHACTREEDYISRYREESMWSDVGSILHKPVAECQQLFDRWILEYQHNGDTHRDYSDFKKHFIQWARITIQKESKTLNNNGNNRSDYSRRGRADVPEDISVDF